MIDEWANCYDNGWNSDLLVPEAFSHPAKMARGLVFKIISHLLEEGWIQPGQTIVDPFGGVATTALPTLLAGLNYVGVELEPRFCELGRKNIEMWTSKFSGMPKWQGTAQLIQGDSRKLAELVSGAAVVTSPPYADGCAHTGGDDSQNIHLQGGTRNRFGVDNYGSTPGQLGSLKAGDVALVTSPPYVSGGHHPDQTGSWGGAVGTGQPTGKDKDVSGYGSTNGQLGKLKEGNHIDALVTSPPFAGNSGGRGEASRNGINAALFDRHSGGMVGGMGDEPGNLGNLRGVVTSPPFENNGNTKDLDFWHKHLSDIKRNPANPGQMAGINNYGSAPGQIGNDQGETFWQAARTIVEQCALILPSGAPAVFVVKDFVKGGKRVEFSAQWAALCEVCGFRVIHIHRALLVKDGGTSLTLEGEAVTKTVARKSFFRRLSESRVQAQKHWQTLERDDQAAILRASHLVTWADYNRRLSSFQAGFDDREPPVPNRARILRNAQVAALERDGTPHYEVETEINYETVLCTVRV